MTDRDYIEQSLLLPDPAERLARWRDDFRLRRLLPEVYALQGVPQPPRYHPEGDVFTHTLLAVAALSATDDPRLAWAALLHDVGKVQTTREVGGRIRALGHDRAGAKLAAPVLARLGLGEAFRQDVLWLIGHHMFALSWQLDAVDRLSHRQWRLVADPRFPLLVALLHIDALAAGARPDKLAQAALYRQARRQLEGD